MRLVLANAILGAALTWAVLHDRTPAPAAPGPTEAPAPAPASDLAALPQVPEPPELRPAPEPARRPAPRLPAAADPPLALAGRSPLDAPKAPEPADEPAVTTARAERLTALDALAAEMELFALHRRR